MRKQILLFGLLLSISSASYANWFADIIRAINLQAGITNGILNNELGLQQDMLQSQEEMQKLLGQLNNNTTGHSGYGNYQFHDYQSYGDGAKNWTNVIDMAEHGHGDGAFGEMIGSVSRDFPSDRNAYNQGVTNPYAQRYYATKSHTTIVARAASELDFNKIQEEIAYQQMLMQQIEHTKDIKSAMDLANRIQVEGNLINLQILRQSALVNQQQAVTEQASVMGALSNAKFLTKK